jgi:hypothetical protein
LPFDKDHQRYEIDVQADQTPAEKDAK